MPDLRDDPTPREHTWQEATDNIRSGNIALKNNVRFAVANYKYIDNKWSSPPPIRLRLKVMTQNDEQVITFRDGSYWGIVNEGASGNQWDVGYFMYLQGHEVIGQTANGTPYTWHSAGAVLRRIEYSPDGVHTYELDTMEIELGFAMLINNDGTFEDYALYGVLYPAIATGIVYYEVNYNKAIIDDWAGIWGYPEASSDIINWLCGEQAEPEQFPGDPSATGGGSGWFISQNDVIGIPSLPSIQAIDFGFSTIYNPTVAQMQSIAAWLWSDDFDENIKLNFVSPFDNIISISLVPMNVPSIAGILRVGNVDSNIPVNKVTQQYHEIDCGSLNVLEFWGSFLDYNAAYSIWLPFIGYRSLKPDDMVNGTIGVIYHVDILTGLVLAFIWTIKEDGIKHVLYTYTGNMNYNVAFSGANYMAMYNQQLSATVSGINNAVQSVGKALSGDITGAVDLLTGQQMAKRQYETAKPDYGRGGNGSGGAAIFGIRYPYLIQTLPIGQVPDNYGKLNGYPSQVYAKLSDLHGYTEIDRVITDTLTSCTAEEKEEIIRMLKNGVVL